MASPAYAIMFDAAAGAESRRFSESPKTRERVGFILGAVTGEVTMWSSKIFIALTSFVGGERWVVLDGESGVSSLGCILGN